MHDAAIWVIAAATVLAILLRPLRMGEWVWPVLAAAALVGFRLLSGRYAAAAAYDGLEVYAFLGGMLALAELMRVHAVFEWIVDVLVTRAHGNTARLFGSVFAIAVAVTALLSNDGTIVLLTPAALVLARTARVPVLPVAFTIAFVANAASFVLPISNPANLVVFAPLPRLVPWLEVFAAPSALAILCTYAVMRLHYAAELKPACASVAPNVPLSKGGRLTLLVVGISLALLVAAAGLNLPVGYAALALGIASVAIVSIGEVTTARSVSRGAPWSIIPLVAGLFVVVRALDSTGALELARSLLRQASAMPPVLGRLYAGGAVMMTDTLVNNLPAGVIARYAVQGTGIAAHVAHAVLVGIDLGPNLSVSGSLATLLWVAMLRRDGIEVNPWRFLRIGALVTIPSLALALVAVR